MGLTELGVRIVKVGIDSATAELVKKFIENGANKIFEKNSFSQSKKTTCQVSIGRYLDYVCKKALKMNTIVFRGTTKFLTDLYIPLNIITDIDIIHADHIRRNEFTIDDACVEKLKNENRMLIVDTAGMGKSTITKYMIVQYIINTDSVPILVELRKITNKMTILEYIVNQFNFLDMDLDEENVKDMLKDGKFIIFFDGYDEIIDQNDKGRILEEIEDLLLLAENNKYVITSRDESDLNALGNFRRYKIKPLKIDEAFQLIRKYDNDGELSDKLINRIKEDSQLDILKELLVNPLLISLLYKTFQYKEEISYKKIGFYGQVYDALFNDHDKTKGGAYVHPKKSGLDISEFERLLRRIAFFSLQKNKIEYNKSDLLEIIKESIDSMSWIKANAEYVMYDISHTIPFFRQEGIDYKWVHKSFMEYFAAGFICYESNQAEKLIGQMSKSTNIDSYLNILDFCFEIKPEICRKTIVYPFLNKFIQWVENHYTDKNYSFYDDKMINVAQYLSFSNNMGIIHFEDYEELRKTFKNNIRESEVVKNSFSWYPQGISHIHGTMFLSFISSKIEEKIGELLRLKNIDIFNVYQSSLADRFIINKINKPKTGSYEISDDINQWYNSQKGFKEMLKIFTRNRTIGKTYKGYFYLDISKVYRLKEEIENEIKKQNQIKIDLF